MEYWDLVDENRTPLGVKHPRGRQFPMPAGTYHTVVMIFTVDEAGHLLITKRAHTKGMYPDYWEVTGGSGIAGEDSLTSACRELKEETGLEAPPADMVLLDTVREPSAFMDIYLYRLPHATEASITLQDGETTAWQWISFRNFELILQRGLIPPPVAMRYGAVLAKLQALVGDPFYHLYEPLDPALSDCPAAGHRGDTNGTREVTP